MDFFEVVKKRRSIRKFKPDAVPDAMVHAALAAAVLAPNSSNTQTWDFHWIKNAELKKKVIAACLHQSAARTASQLIVITADPRLWKRSQSRLIDWVKQASAPKVVLFYYQKLIPMTYSPGFLNIFFPFKFLLVLLTGFFRPITRGPLSRRDIEEVAIKSAALAAENFVLAMSAQGAATCMMEGFDEWRLRRALKLKRSTRIVMAIAIGYEAENGSWGPQYRLPLDEVVHVYD